jgi:small subunit ribosomal protein S8
LVIPAHGAENHQLDFNVWINKNLRSKFLMDPVADLLTRIRNANIARHAKTEMPHSRLKEGIARVLKEEGYIQDYQVAGEGPRKALHVYLRYTPDRERVLTSLVRVSRPGRRVHRGVRRMERVLDGLGIGILSTHRGILSDREARKKGVGGELLCKVW